MQIQCQNDKVKSIQMRNPESGMSDKKILAAAVRATGEHAAAKVIWARYPLLERIATAYARYVGMESVDALGGSLLVAAVKHALHDVQQHENDDVARAAFVNALLEHSSDVFSQLAVVETDSGGVQWMPFACGLPEFVSKYPDGQLTVTRKPCAISSEMARMFMIMKILPSSLLDEESLQEFLNPVALAA